MTGRRFRPTRWGTLAAIVGIAATVALGFWQLDRAHRKESTAAEQARFADAPAVRIGPESAVTEALEARTVEAYGRFESAGLILLDNRVRRGIAGYEVVMPLRIERSESRVLVNRGWTPAPRDRRRLPELATPEGVVQVRGRAVVPGRRFFELSPEVASGRVWQNLTIERYTSHMGIIVSPILIEQSNDLGDGLLRDWPEPDRGASTNRSYAIQWFAFAVLIAVLYVALSFRNDAANA